MLCLYSKLLPLFDGLVKDADEHLIHEFENKCGEFSIYYTLAKAVMRREIDKKYIDLICSKASFVSENILKSLAESM